MLVVYYNNHYIKWQLSCYAHFFDSAKKNELRAEYGKLKRQARDYGVVKKNVDSILNPGTERAQGRNRGVEL